MSDTKAGCPIRPLNGYVVVKPLQQEGDTMVTVTRYREPYQQGVLVYPDEDMEAGVTVAYTPEGVIPMLGYELVPYRSLLAVIKGDVDE